MDSPSETPDVIGRYDVIRELGRGGMGVVYLAHDPFIDRQVAIKTILASPSIDPKTLEYYQKLFFNEAKAVGKLTHPHIVSLYDAMWEKDRCYLIMEYVEGTSLKEYCSKKSLQPIEYVIGCIFQSAKALDYAHQNGVIHRDIKPGNIMISSDHKVKIADFGIAQVEGVSAASPSGAIGTVYYSAPELVHKGPPSAQTDLFALGVVLYELLTGTKPFKGRDKDTIFAKIAMDNPAPLREYREDVPETLELILMQALEKDLAKRYQSCLQFASHLSAAFDSLKSSDEEINSREKLNALKKLRFFEDFTASELAEVLRTTQWLRCDPEEKIITEGDMDDCFYIVISGKVRVTRRNRKLAVLGAGECFGEMAYLGTQKRTATIQAQGSTILMKINASVVAQTSLSTQLSFYKVFSHTLIERLNHTSEASSTMSS
ncbi:MAG: serine/threonine-protein kinase [Desulfobacterales bacterium]